MNKAGRPTFISSESRMMTSILIDFDIDHEDEDSLEEKQQWNFYFLLTGTGAD